MLCFSQNTTEIKKKTNRKTIYRIATWLTCAHFLYVLDMLVSSDNSVWRSSGFSTAPTARLFLHCGRSIATAHLVQYVGNVAELGPYGERINDYVVCLAWRWQPLFWCILIRQRLYAHYTATKCHSHEYEFWIVIARAERKGAFSCISILRTELIRHLSVR